MEKPERIDDTEAFASQARLRVMRPTLHYFAGMAACAVERPRVSAEPSEALQATD